MSEKIRLNKYMARCGLGSRRECDRLISAGLVTINGSLVDELGVKVNEEDIILFKGKAIELIKKVEYIAYHKQPGTVVTKIDPENRETIYDAIKTKTGYDASLLTYVGRLDMFSEGLLLLTNDGDLIHSLTHPKFHIKKVYKIKLDRAMTPEDARLLVNDGIEDREQLLKAGAVRIRGGDFCEIDLYEGKNRQIRRMLEALDYKILKLIRLQYGAVKLRDLQPGSYRELAEREVKALKSKGYN